MPTPKPRPLALSALLLLLTVLCGLALRFAPLGLPHFLVKYGGSTTWALCIYWLLSTAFPSRPILPVALAAIALATAVEFFKLLHTPTLDAFRLTLPGILLLGRLFSFADILAYALAISAGALIDGKLRS